MSTTVQTQSQYVFGPNGSGDILHFTNKQGQIVSWIDGSGLGQGNLAGGLPQFASYILSVTGGVVSARNNTTGNVDYSGSDASIVINNVLNAMASTGGTIYFKNGVYNCNSITQETTGGFSHYYAIGIPAPPSTLCVDFHFVGESMTFWDGEGSGLAIQTNGVIFNITSTAVSSVSAGTLIAGIWNRPDTVNSVGQYCFFENVTVRFPDNQRGNEIAFYLRQANIVSYENTLADFNVSYSSTLATSVPVAGANGLIGYTTTRSATGNMQHFKNTYASGYDIAYDIQSEHSVGDTTSAIFCNIPYYFGRSSANGTIYHPCIWNKMGYQECLRGINFGTAMAVGSSVYIWGLDIELAGSGGVGNPTFAAVAGMVEATPGNTNGIISLNAITQNVGITDIANVFTSGGTSITILQGTKPTPGLLTTSTTSAATTGTTKQTLATYTLKPSAFSANGNTVRVKAWGITAANANSKTFEIDFGSTVASTITATTNNGSVVVEATIIRAGASSQECAGTGISGTTVNSTRAAGSETDTANIIITAAATTPTASGDFTFKGWTIEYLAGSH